MVFVCGGLQRKFENGKGLLVFPNHITLEKKTEMLLVRDLGVTSMPSLMPYWKSIHLFNKYLVSTTHQDSGCLGYVSQPKKTKSPAPVKQILWNGK